jgi:hypothetical protein
MAFQIFPSTGGTATFDGIFIPVGDLLNGGIEGAVEFADVEPAALKRDKALFAVSEIVTAYIDGLAAGLALGVSVTRPNVTTLNYTYGLSLQLHEVLGSGSPLAPIPVPSAGANAGIGDFAMTDIFPNAVKLASTADPGGAGVLIESASLAGYGAPTHASLNLATDCRMVLGALFRYMASSTDLPLRSTTEASAVTSKTAGAYTSFTAPAAYTADTDPTSDLAAADLPRTVLIAQPASVTFNLVASSPAPTLELEINSVTA